MSIEQSIENMITPSLREKGFRVVRVQLQGSKGKTLQIMIERLDEIAITVDDCAIVSRTVSVLLDVEDPIHEPYTLEVSSPGMDRPLIKKDDFERFVGSMIKLELTTPYEGHLRFQGLLRGIEEDKVKIELDPEKEVAEIAFSDVKKAKLIPDYDNVQVKVRKR
ncbi:MAG: ribosome maturation factor RimP [Alphaproteobacteria bacterium]|nr:ribosome maturation factor RimP [Alphaproteobacteria bacterium]